MWNFTLLTDIWFVVKVPVLSEQITEVQPNVSTEGKDLTIAFFLAIRLVPAKDSMEWVGNLSACSLHHRYNQKLRKKIGAQVIPPNKHAFKSTSLYKSPNGGNASGLFGKHFLPIAILWGQFIYFDDKKVPFTRKIWVTSSFWVKEWGRGRSSLFACLRHTSPCLIDSLDAFSSKFPFYAFGFALWYQWTNKDVWLDCSVT